MKARETRRLLEATDFPQLKRRLITATGLAYYQNKEEELAAQVVGRMSALGLQEARDYDDRLSDERLGPAELDAIATLLTIGETYFFRHQELFDSLRDRVFPELIRRKSDVRHLRIWSAGCAIGAEAYSISILLAREFSQQLAGWDVSILGTDINRDFLAQAAHGEFNEWAFRSMTEDFKRAHFYRHGSKWRIRDAYREGVSFQYHNLVQHHFPCLANNLAAFDLILCRNVMIYFEPAVVERLVEQFRESLVPQGWFAVGPVEPNINTYRKFETVNAPGVVLYQRKEAAIDERREWLTPNWVSTYFPPAETPPAAPAVETMTLPVVQNDSRSAMEPTEIFDLKAIHDLMDRGEWEAAREGCARLELTERLNPRFHFYAALIAEHTGRPFESAESLKRALYLDRNYVLAHYYLGLLAQRAGEPGAQRSFQNVLTLLAPRGGEEIVPDADGLTVNELGQLSRMQLALLSTP